MWPLFTLLFVILFSTQPVQAVEEFNFKNQLDYAVSTDLSAHVTHTVQITNNFSNIYPKEYQFQVSTNSLQNISAHSGNYVLDVATAVSGNTTTVNIPLENPGLGKDKSTELVVTYTLPSFLTKNGSIYELKTPSFNSDSLNAQTSINLSLPLTIGQIISSSPPPTTTSHDTSTTHVSYELRGQKIAPISISLGEAQYYSFKLKYELTENKNTITIPPETATQHIIITNISMLPESVQKDPDGNLLFSYPKSGITDVTLSGYARVGDNKSFSATIPASYLTLPTSLWQSDSSDIQAIAATVSTPKDIYNYVVKTLSYDYSKLNKPLRLGAEETLARPQNALCTEFVDLTIALLRAKGIPAREHEGYAQSTNSTAKPTNPNSDVLHAWVEYYDTHTKTWRQIDPTWGNTTLGLDYFSSIDQNRITFVIHGSSPTSPEPAGAFRTSTSEKQVDVTPLETNPPKELTAKPSIKINNNFPPEVTINNPNGQTLKNITLNNVSMPDILPFETKTVTLPHLAKKLFTPGGFVIPLTLVYSDQSTTYQLVSTPIFVFQMGLVILVLFVLAFFVVKLSRESHEKNR